MKKLLASLALLIVSMASHAEIDVDGVDGRILYFGVCNSHYAFSYFDGRRIQRGCIVDTQYLSVAWIVDLSREDDCRGQVRVTGVIREDVLYADLVEKVRGCQDGGGRRTT